MKFISSLIVVKDMQRSRRFYEEILGLPVALDFGENLTFEGGFSIHLESHFMNLLGSPGALPGYGSRSFELYFESPHLEELQQKLHGAGVPILHGIREHPWRQRAMRLCDPDSHIIEVGEPMEAVIQRMETRCPPKECRLQQACPWPGSPMSWPRHPPSKRNLQPEALSDRPTHPNRSPLLRPPRRSPCHRRSDPSPPP